MKININGVTRDMTAAEEAELLATASTEHPLSDAERMDEIEAAMIELAGMIGGGENG